VTGSHDSASCSITPSSGIAPDAIPCVQRLAKMFGPLVKRFVFKWSVTQHASIKEQLHCGVRFVCDKFKLQFNASDSHIYMFSGDMQIESHMLLDSNVVLTLWWNRLTVWLLTVEGYNNYESHF
jgi:hypothetical protein